MMRRECFVILLGLLPLWVAAGNRTFSQMQAIAQRQLGNTTRSTGDGLRLENIYENEALVVFGDTTAGFAVISRDQSQLPVLGVSHGAFCQSDAPEGFSWWLRAMTRRLSTGVPLRTRSVTAVPNFVLTHWDQTDPYNGLCPKSGTKTCPTGCVATAMAQVMKRYNYPVQGKGRGSYTVGSSYVKHSQVINSVYDWENMRNSYGKSSGTTQKKAVQQLMYDAGVAVNMKYDKDGSAAYSLDAAIAMFKNFSYDSLAIRYLIRDFYSEEEWEDIVYGELAKTSPVIYSGNDKENDVGHAFLLTGNDEEGRVYVNWGWGLGGAEGSYDGYFMLNDLRLGDTYDFSDYNDMVIGFRPQEKPDNNERITSQWCYSKPFRLKVMNKSRLEFSIFEFYNYHVLHFQGKLLYGFRNIVSGKTEYMTMVDLQRDVVAPLFGFVPDLGEDIQKDTISTSTLAAGTYEFTISSQARGETSPTVMRTTNGFQTFLVTKASDGTITVKAQTTDVADVKQAAPDGESPVYNLRGQQVMSPGASGDKSLPRGIYIRNGRKFIQK